MHINIKVFFSNKLRFFLYILLCTLRTIAIGNKGGRICRWWENSCWLIRKTCHLSHFSQVLHNYECFSAIKQNLLKILSYSNLSKNEISFFFYRKNFHTNIIWIREKKNAPINEKTLHERFFKKNVARWCDSKWNVTHLYS